VGKHLQGWTNCQEHRAWTNMQMNHQSMLASCSHEHKTGQRGKGYLKTGYFSQFYVKESGGPPN
jgi:hypothetical protein